MLCQNCGESTANVRYTQIINGEKKEYILCEKCAHKLGIDMVDFKVPSHFSNFLGNMFNDFESDVFTSIDREFNRLNSFNNNLEIPDNSYLFEIDKPKDDKENDEEFDQILEDLKNSSKLNNKNTNKNYSNEVINPNKKDNNQSNNRNSKKEELQEKLEIAIKEERFEDAAKLRDEIKKIK